LPVGGNLYGAANFDKIKNSKLFQKFMTKEQTQGKVEDGKSLKSISSKASI